MQRVIFLAWQNIAFRLIVGWGVVVILPALLMWRMRFLQGRWLITEFNSMVLATLGVLLVTLGLRKLTEFPGQRSISFVLPTLLLVMMLIMNYQIMSREELMRIVLKRKTLLEIRQIHLLQFQSQQRM